MRSDIEVWSAGFVLPVSSTVDALHLHRVVGVPAHLVSSWRAQRQQQSRPAEMSGDRWFAQIDPLMTSQVNER